MYKYTQTKKYYLAAHTFKKAAKKVSKHYCTGFRLYEADDMKGCILVIHRFRLILELKRSSQAPAVVKV